VVPGRHLPIIIDLRMRAFLSRWRGAFLLPNTSKAYVTAFGAIRPGLQSIPSGFDRSGIK
jgi:hypothetical protein